LGYPLALVKINFPVGSIKKRGILEKSRKNTIFIISGFNGGHRNEKKSPVYSIMLEILMSDPLVYSQTTVSCDL
jgi:hypothetical protein